MPNILPFVSHYLSHRYIHIARPYTLIPGVRTKSLFNVMHAHRSCCACHIPVIRYVQRRSICWGTIPTRVPILGRYGGINSVPSAECHNWAYPDASKFGFFRSNPKNQNQKIKKNSGPPVRGKPEPIVRLHDPHWRPTRYT
jgi:hypothetical protein